MNNTKKKVKKRWRCPACGNTVSDQCMQVLDTYGETGRLCLRCRKACYFDFYPVSQVVTTTYKVEDGETYVENVSVDYLQEA